MLFRSGIQADDDILVRGLGDRYNQVTINGLPIPSPNPDQKNINLDLIPKSAISNMKVRKTYSPDQWSEVSGAQIDITSKHIEKSGVMASMSVNTDAYTPAISYRFNMASYYKKGIYSGYFAFMNQNQRRIGTGFTKLVNKQGSEILNYSLESDNKLDVNSLVYINNINYKKINIDAFTLLSKINQLNDRTSFGDHFDYNNQLYTTRITPNNQLLFTQQLNFKWVSNNHKINMNNGYSYINSGEKDREQFVYLYNGEDYIINKIDKLDNHLFSNQNIENRFNTKAYYTFENDKLKAQVGVVKYISMMEFDYQQSYYDMNNNQELVAINDPASYVEGKVDINSAFINALYKSKRINIGAGLRYDSPIQEVLYRDQLQPIYIQKVYRNDNVLLPTFFTKFAINDAQQIRFNVSKTVIRPRFRELVPFEYTEFFASSKIRGNPELLNSIAYNIDLNYEYYFNKKDVISAGVFYKMIDKPIERVSLATASGRLESYQNSDMAEVYGLEFEIKKKIKDFQIDFNTSLLQSRLVVDTTNTSVIVTNTERQLQGSSPLIINFDVLYDLKIKDKIISLGLMYNYNSPKLFSAGIAGIGDTYQRELHTLNFVAKSKLTERLDLRLTVNNILKNNVEFYQGTDIGDITTQRLDGRIITGLKVSYKL